LATGEPEEAGRRPRVLVRGSGEDLVHERGGGELRGALLREVRVAPARAVCAGALGVALAVGVVAAPEITAGEADEHGGAAGPGALALERAPDGLDCVALRAGRGVLAARSQPGLGRQIHPFALASS